MLISYAKKQTKELKKLTTKEIIKVLGCGAKEANSLKQLCNEE